MNISDQLKLIPDHLPQESRVWIYQANRSFTDQELLEINEQLEHFYLQWQVHGAAVTGWAGVLFKHFILFVADERQQKVSGCSIDSTVKILKSLERQYNIQLFDRMTLTFWVNDQVEMLPLNQLSYAIAQNYIQPNTLIFNNLIDQLENLKEQWLVPLQASWAKQYI